MNICSANLEGFLMLNKFNTFSFILNYMKYTSETVATWYKIFHPILGKGERLR